VSFLGTTRCGCGFADTPTDDTTLPQGRDITQDEGLDLGTRQLAHPNEGGVHDIIPTREATVRNMWKLVETDQQIQWIWRPVPRRAAPLR